jgi:hypothetical protein
MTERNGMVAATGPTGPGGPAGPTGEKGATGEEGATGNRSDRGQRVLLGLQLVDLRRQAARNDDRIQKHIP